MVYRSSPAAPEAAEKLSKEFGIIAKAYQADVGDLKVVRQVFSQIVKEFGGLVHGVVAVSYTCTDFDPEC